MTTNFQQNFTCQFVFLPPLDLSLFRHFEPQQCLTSNTRISLCTMMDSRPSTPRKSATSRKSTSSSSSKSRRSSTRKSGGSNGSKSRSPNRSEPRRSKRAKEDLEAKERARGDLDNGNVAFNAIDHTGAVLEPSVEAGQRMKNHRSSKRRSQQDRGITKDNAAKAKNLINRPIEANAGPTPGAHADSRGDQVAKDKNASGKGRFSRPMGTQSVFSTEDRVRMEAEKAKENEGLVKASAVDETDDPDLAMALLNSLLDQQLNNNNTSKEEQGRPSQENNEESNGNDREQSRRKKGVTFFRFVCCVLVLGAAGVGTWIALRGNSNSNNSASDTMEPSLEIPINTTAGNGTIVPDDSTLDPIDTVNPSATGPPNGAPINDNVDNDVIFAPPSVEDCAAISNGGAIEGFGSSLEQQGCRQCYFRNWRWRRCGRIANRTSTSIAKGRK